MNNWRVRGGLRGGGMGDEVRIREGRACPTVSSVPERLNVNVIN